MRHLVKVQQVLYLGMVVDSTLQAFSIPEDKRKFAHVTESLLNQKGAILLRSLQKLMGKCIFFSLAFPGAKFYIRGPLRRD